MSSFPATFRSSRIRVMHCSREIHIIRRCASRRWDGFGRHGSAFTIERLQLRMVRILSGFGLDGMMSMISSSAHGVEGFPRPNQALQATPVSTGLVVLSRRPSVPELDR